MAYVIEYGGQVPAGHLVAKRKHYGWLIAIACLVLVGTVQYLFPEFVEQVKQLLIPGEDAVTVQAFENMVEGLRDGGGLSDCVTVFCREVIYGAS